MYKTITSSMFDIDYTTSNSLFFSKSEINKTGDGLRLDILLPGFTKEEVTVNLDDKELVISAETERKLPSYLNNNVRKTYIVEDVDVDTIKAVLENGVLSVSFSTAKKVVGRNISVL
jgi:HSP20 family protein